MTKHTTMVDDDDDFDPRLEVTYDSDEAQAPVTSAEDKTGQAGRARPEDTSPTFDQSEYRRAIEFFKRGAMDGLSAEEIAAYKSVKDLTPDDFWIISWLSTRGVAPAVARIEDAIRAVDVVTKDAQEIPRAMIQVIENGEQRLAIQLETLRVSASHLHSQIIKQYTVPLRKMIDEQVKESLSEVRVSLIDSVQDAVKSPIRRNLLSVVAVGLPITGLIFAMGYIAALLTVG